MAPKINGHHIVFDLNVPVQLVQIRNSYRRWLPMHRALKVLTRLNNSMASPRVALERVWPQLAAWVIIDEVYGMRQFLPDTPQMRDILHNIISVLDRNGKGIAVPESDKVEALRVFLAFPGAASMDAQWKAVYACFKGDADIALRLAATANQRHQPGNKEVVLVAYLESALAKILELLKA